MASGIEVGIEHLTEAEVIGRGGFSTVYAATDTRFDRRVAVKVLRELAKESDRSRFERECRVMGRLSSHPAVVTVYHAGYTDDDKPYIIMELNEGGSLADRLEADGPMRWQDALGYMIPICRALQHAHDADILHRDVKPENILLTDGMPQLTDFGIAYLRDSTGSTSTNITASWLHTAPETFDNKRDERSDVYSAASTLYNLIAAKAPFENPDDESLNPLMRRLLNDAPPPLPARAGPAALDAYLQRALAKDPDERPPSAAAFGDGLQVILDSGGLKMPTNGVVGAPLDGPSQRAPDPGPGRPTGGSSAPAGSPSAGTTPSRQTVPGRPAPSLDPTNQPAASASGTPGGGPPGAGPAGSGGPRAWGGGAPLGAPDPNRRLNPPPGYPANPLSSQAAPPGHPNPHLHSPPAGFGGAGTPSPGSYQPTGGGLQGGNPAGASVAVPGVGPSASATPASGAAGGGNPPGAPAGAAPWGRSPGSASQQSATPDESDGSATMLVFLGVIAVAVIGVAILGMTLLFTTTEPSTERVQSEDRPVERDAADTGGEAQAEPDEGGGQPTTTDVPPPEPTGVDLPTFDTPAESIDELEQRWALARSTVVDVLSSEVYGIDEGGILRGPGGLAVDLGDCPAGWSDPIDPEAATIPIGHTTAQTGDLASYGNFGRGIEAYFAYVNDRHGGIGGRPVELITRDDRYEVEATIEAVDSLVVDDGVFAITTFGTPGTLATYDRLNAECIPQPFVISGHPGLGDPVAHPFTSGLSMSWSTEAELWGTWIEQNMADQLPVRVAALVMANDFGITYQSPFEIWAAEHPDVVSDFIPISHDPLATAVDAEMSEIATLQPDVFIAMTASPFCSLAAQGGEAAGLNDITDVRFQPSVCRDQAPNLAPAGLAADGYLVIGGGTRSVFDSGATDDPYLAFVSEQLAAAGADDSGGEASAGFGLYAWTWVEALRIADDLPGGLSRSNLLLAIRGMRLHHPMLIDGISFATWGNEDAFFVEGSAVGTYDAANETWIPGPIIDIDGQTPNCTWSVDGC